MDDSILIKTVDLVKIYPMGGESITALAGVSLTFKKSAEGLPVEAEMEWKSVVGKKLLTLNS